MTKPIDAASEVLGAVEILSASSFRLGARRRRVEESELREALAEDLYLRLFLRRGNSLEQKRPDFERWFLASLNGKLGGLSPESSVPGVISLRKGVLGASPIHTVWNLPPSELLQAIESVASKFAASRTSFHLRVRADPSLYRADVLVLSFASGDAEEVGEIFHQCEKFSVSLLESLTYLSFRPDVPLCAASLAPGIAWCAGEESIEEFGRRRCRLFADGLVDAWNRGLHDEDRRLALRDAFEAAGLRLDRPHLDAASGATRLSELPFAGAFPEPKASEGLRDGLQKGLKSAVGDLSETRIKHDGRCTWTTLPAATSSAESVRAIGPTLADGAAGVALIFAEMQARSWSYDDLNAEIQETLRQALDAARADSPWPAFDFLHGRFGILWAAEVVADRTGDVEPGSRCEDLLALLLADETAPFDHFDARAALALLDLARRRPRLAARALVIAERIAEALKARDLPNVENLCAETAATSAAALAESARQFDRPSFAAAARTLMSASSLSADAAWKTLTCFRLCSVDPKRCEEMKKAGEEALKIVVERLRAAPWDHADASLGSGLGLLIEAAAAAGAVEAAREALERWTRRHGFGAGIDDTTYYKWSWMPSRPALWDGSCGVMWSALRVLEDQEKLPSLHLPGWRTT